VVTVIVALGIIAPDGSETVPRIDPFPACAGEGAVGVEVDGICAGVVCANAMHPQAVVAAMLRPNKKAKSFDTMSLPRNSRVGGSSCHVLSRLALQRACETPAFGSRAIREMSTRSHGPQLMSPGRPFIESRSFLEQKINPLLQAISDAKGELSPGGDLKGTSRVPCREAGFTNLCSS
jgi:hypothetical protein